MVEGLSGEGGGVKNVSLPFKGRAGLMFPRVSFSVPLDALENFAHTHAPSPSRGGPGWGWGELSWSVDPILTLALSLKEREFLGLPSLVEMIKAPGFPVSLGGEGAICTARRYTRAA